MSYHDNIQKVARIIEQSREKLYSKQSEIRFSPNELVYIHGALYKVERVLYTTKNEPKALDDIVDAYNYLALLYNSIYDRMEIES